MKTKLLKRVSIAASSVLGAVGVLVALLETFGVDVAGLFHKAAGASVVILILLIIVLAALLGVCAYSFYLALFGEKAMSARMITLNGTNDDVVFIKQETLDEFVASVIGQPEGVTEISAQAKYQDGALDVTVTMSVNMDADISALTSEIQSVIREQLENVNGIKLGRVAVVISGIVVPENTQGVKMPWADKKAEETIEEKSEETIEVKAEEKSVEIEDTEEALFAEEPVRETAEEPAETIVISEGNEEKLA